MTKIVELCAQNDRHILFICDFSPPKGSNPELFKAVTHLDADIISVAYNPGKSVRVSSPVAAHWIRQITGKEVLFTLATRDMNKLAIQSSLIVADLLGLENVIVVMGDKFSSQESNLVREVFDYRTTSLILALRKMNEGIDFRNLKLSSSTKFSIGAAIDLGRGLPRETKLVRQKLNAGADFFISQQPHLFHSELLYELVYNSRTKCMVLSQPKFGGKALISTKKHKNGTERISEFAKKIKANLFIDVHADEALLNPKNVDRLIEFHKKNKSFDIVVPLHIHNSQYILLCSVIVYWACDLNPMINVTCHQISRRNKDLCITIIAKDIHTRML